MILHRTKPLLLILAMMMLAANVFANDQGVSFTDAYVRANIPGQKMAAAFLVIHNNTDKAIVLKSYRTKAAELVQLHEQALKDGQMKMRKLEQVEIPAHGKLDFKARGYHLMLLGLKNNLQEGSSITLALCFDTLCSKVKMPVRTVFNEK